LPESIRVISSLSPSDNELEPEPIDEPVFFKADNDFVPMFFTLDIGNFLYFVVDDLSMGSPHDQLKLSQVENPIKELSIVFLGFVNHTTFFESSIDDSFGQEVEDFCFSVELSLLVVEKIY